VFTKNRAALSKVRSGGIALAVKNSISKQFKFVNSTCKYVIWFKISKNLLKKMKIFFLELYTSHLKIANMHHPIATVR
jgi:uncharacterized membrane protein YobD (UPF0266 family)